MRHACDAGRALAVALVVLLGACSSSDGTSSAPASSAVPAQLTGAPSVELTTDQQTAAATEATRFADQLVATHPELAGISAATITAVYDETSPAPIGAMAHWSWPSRIPEVQLDLVRLHRSGPETMPSRITNLRAMEMIYLFDRGEVVYVGVAPGPDDAADPDNAAVVRPIDPDQHRSTEFGGTE